MSSRLEIPLHLFEVLEEEYISLHGPIPAGEVLTIKLPNVEAEDKWREVRAARNWLFDEGHIKDPVGLANSLLSSAQADQRRAHASDHAREELRRYLVPDDRNVPAPIDRNMLRKLSEFGSGDRNHRRSVPRELVKPLEDALNGLLLDKSLYDSDRFSDNWLSDSSQGLVEIRDSFTDSEDELCHFNRLLLEDAFPEALEKISNIRLAAMYQRFHNVEQKALCHSGGGIRSGTFALGVLQGLARHDLLKQFDYLSTVSGGGYIGGWLTAWIHRHHDGLEGVTEDMANSAPKTKVDPDPHPIRYLRTYSNFITPKAGLLSADTWTFAGIYLRNLFLNWLVIIPLLISLLLIPRLVLTITQMQPEPALGQDQPEPLIRNLFGLIDFHSRYIFLIIGFALGVWALTYVIFNRPSLREKLETRSRFWRARTNQGSFLRWCLLPLTVASFCLTTYWAWSRELDKTQTPILNFLIFGTSFTFLAWLIASFVIRRRWKEINLIELFALLVAGVISGLFFWALEQPDFTSPVIGYDKPFVWTTTEWAAWKTEWYVCFAVPIFLLIFLLAVTFFIGLSSVSTRIVDEDREWWARFSAWGLIVVGAWSVFNWLVIFGPFALLEFPTIFASAGGLTGLLALLIGRSSQTPANKKEEAKGGILASLMGSLLPLLAFIFLALFIAAVSLATTGLIKGLAGLAQWLNEDKHVSSDKIEWLTNARTFTDYIGYLNPQPVIPVSAVEYLQIVHMNVLHHTSTWLVLGLGLIMLGVGMLLARLINLNLFSLHGGYRNRLIRAFLGASRPDGERKPNPFTGFDPADNVHMHELRHALLGEGDFVKPEILATALRAALDGAQADALSVYLVQNNLLENSKTELESYRPGDPISPGLIAALRTDLNAVLEEENLYSKDFPQAVAPTEGLLKIQQELKTPQEISTLGEDSLRSDYHILLNRLAIEHHYPQAIKPYPPPPYKLLHIVNTTLNLVGGDNLAWQQRKAEPFSVSPLHSGCFRLGYRRSRDYGGRETGGISIGTAAAISGAAASSNMGYYTTSPLMSLLLTLFNVRLGWWLGNPGPAGDQTYFLRAPKYSIAPVLYEAFGLTNDKNKYVYLTDGGHFENLAIYEMVLRRCHIIVVTDGAQDEEYRFSDLGNAVRKIRIDLGVPIEFTSVPIYAKSPPLEDKKKGMYWAIGKIRYKCIDGPDAKDGVLLYIKPAVYKTEPRDILEYKENFPAFPHQTTADQFFDEPQFESYRILGSYIMDQLCGEGTNPLDLYQVIDMAFRQLTEESADLKAADPQLKGWLKDWLPKQTQRFMPVNLSD
ncbi:MAG TPA: patatin-like phospholipase family protein [Pyrinomonadaceae bacterium]|jgi:hypothetical protein